jgi:hypothetical protein
VGGEFVVYHSYIVVHDGFGKESEMEYSFGGTFGQGTLAPQAFQRALRNGRREAFFSRFLQRSCRLVPFETIKTKLHLIGRLEKGRQEIQLDQIVGSVGKHEFFSQSLMPLDGSLENRWKNIYDLMLGLRGYPPIEVYKVNEMYFILDGHHRASVARSLGSPTIEAYVTEWKVLPT